MVENLRVTRDYDGTSIPLITDNTEWSNLTTPAYCWYNNDETTYKNTFGALYNSFSISSGKLCPSGWHVPTKVEWETLEVYLGGWESAGYQLKDYKLGGNNSSSFSAQMGGQRYYDGRFEWNTNFGYWWLATEYVPGSFWSVWMYILYYHTDFSFGKESGYSVRCIKD